VSGRPFGYEESGAVARIVLDRPEALNALTFEVYRELTATFRALTTRKDIRSVLLTGRGRAFCTGGDVKEIIGELLKFDRAGLVAFTRLTCDLIRAMRAAPQPIVAALNGTVAGAGAVIAAASDIRIAVESAKIAFLFSRVGLTGADMGAAWLLPRIVGMAHASEILMLGDFISAERAAQIGLYNRVVPGDRLLAEANEVAARLARGPSASLGITKQALNEEASMDLVAAIEWEAQVQARCMQHPDFREAYEAFRAKREPRFE
jgi:enoyl-CoA hydratase/carnithine racemase